MAGPNPRIVGNVIAGRVSGNGDDSQTTDPAAWAWLYVFGQLVGHDRSLGDEIRCAGTAARWSKRSASSHRTRW
jgi:hypothetical protein